MATNNSRPNDVLIYCAETEEGSYHSRLVADAVADMETLPDVDQARMMKLARHMVAKTWPHDLDDMPTWTQDQFREAVDSLPESP